MFSKENTLLKEQTRAMGDKQTKAVLTENSDSKNNF